ncbi:hypothetical protein [Actinophytocola algeriensis]|jgi:hypothetical protein|uniref:Uncharacterized protein n=1 Tax=Actinophytocola algeriensis TaxID=1768010 RepID=A0A7W7Q276_9PSEU|nr:hypothetical protein [Actinophytocola algeriensis]MBB4905602.1 hypothetical protein [Actinophytocola algeriensis]MBE1472713.1 hypothetical protein [Actinophytocola algeriensis]
MAVLGASLVVSSYVIIREGCPIAISVDGQDQAQITCGWVPSEAFEFVVAREALRALVEVGTDALREMDRLDEPA